MKAAVVHDFNQAPRYADFATPEAGEGEVRVRVRAAALSQLVKAQASGRHYSSGKVLPLVPGVDGVGELRRIPMAVIESAKIDGANEWHIFWNICLPQCRSALYSIAILVFIDNWNMVEQPLILLNDVEKQPLSMFLSSINAGEIGIAFAAAVIYMIPGLLLFLHGEAYLVEGIAHSGSVKG